MTLPDAAFVGVAVYFALASLRTAMLATAQFGESVPEFKRYTYYSMFFGFVAGLCTIAALVRL